jgi:predicted AAA+ superfamily ATPase
MKDDELRSQLTAINPWWAAASSGTDPTAWTAEDATLRDRAGLDLGYRSSVLADLATRKLDDRLVMLRGPRRVGKTAVLKDLAAALCARDDVDPRQIVYIAADAWIAQDFYRAIGHGRDLTRSVDHPEPRPRVWLMDEVTSHTGWTPTLRFLRENTRLGQDLVVCTGSSWAYEAEVADELLTGGAGAADPRRSRLIAPMSFRNFLATSRPDLPRPAGVHPAELMSDRAARAANRLAPLADELDLAWQAYLTCGGYPRAVTEYHRNGEVGEAFLAEIERGVHQDVDRDAPEKSIVTLLGALQERSGGPLNRAGTSVELGYRTLPSFILRLTRLASTFSALWCPQIGLSGGRVSGAQAKLYLADPIIAWLGPRLRGGLPAPGLTALTESSLAMALAAAVGKHQLGPWEPDERIGYFRGSGGGEVDFAPLPVRSSKGDVRTPPIDLKWISDRWKGKMRPLVTVFGSGIIATKNITDTTGPVWALPAPTLALLLG